MAATFLLTLEYELLLVGAILLFLCLVPIGIINKLGHAILRILYKVHLSSPIPNLINGSMSIILFTGLVSLTCAVWHFYNWHRNYLVKESTDAKQLLKDLDKGAKFRYERDLFLFASSCICFLALHTIARINDEREQAESASSSSSSSSSAASGRTSAVAADPTPRTTAADASSRQTAGGESSKTK